jgi:lysophospholipase L1-like esterase
MKVLLLLALFVLGTAAMSVSYRQVALGNSIAYGMGVKRGREDYPSILRNYAQADLGASVSLTNLAKNGSATDRVLYSLQNDSTYVQAVRAAHILNLTVAGGTNDGVYENRPYVRYQNGVCGGTDNQDCLREDLALFEANFAAILDRLLELRASQPTMIRPTTIYNLPALYAPEHRALLLEWANRMAESTIRLAAERGIPTADLRPAFNGPNFDADPVGLIQSDGVHPNAQGMRVIADQVRAVGYAPLR